MAIITITGEFKTDSEKVASGIARELGFEFIGDQLVAEVARELQVSGNEADIFRQASQTSILRFLDQYACSVIQRVADREQGCFDDDSYYRKTRELVEKIYENENAVILGWGSQCILKGKPDTFHVRLKKEDELKIRETIDSHAITREAAEQMLRSEENDREAYLRKYFSSDWRDSRLYDLVLDMGKITSGEAIDSIYDSAAHHFKIKL